MIPSKPPRCVHTSEGEGSCPACLITHAAEAIVADASGQTGAFLRSPLEQAVLEALASLAPLPLTTLQIACLIEEASYREVKIVLQALVLLDAIARPWKGYYQYRPG